LLIATKSYLRHLSLGQILPFEWFGVGENQYKISVSDTLITNKDKSRVAAT
jgi:hypothetical protein